MPGAGSISKGYMMFGVCDLGEVSARQPVERWAKWLRLWLQDCIVSSTQLTKGPGTFFQQEVARAGKDHSWEVRICESEEVDGAWVGKHWTIGHGGTYHDALCAAVVTRWTYPPRLEDGWGG